MQFRFELEISNAGYTGLDSRQDLNCTSLPSYLKYFPNYLYYKVSDKHSIFLMGNHAFFFSWLLREIFKNL